MFMVLLLSADRSPGPRPISNLDGEKMTDTNLMKEPSFRRRRRSLRAQALVGTALGLLLAGAFAAGDALLSDHSAVAVALPETQVQPAQAPDFADLVRKVSQAGVSTRVGEAPQPQANSNEDFT